MSKFLGFALPVTSREEAQELIKQYTNKYHDARHLCWAFMLGADRSDWLLSDNGEPSGTAGKPILGQINSRNLTNTLVMVVRYFGGIKLGTSGLIAAYRQAAADALDDCEVKEVFKMKELSFTFPYMSANDVMKIVKQGGHEVLNQVFDNSCSMTLSVRESYADEVRSRLEKVSGLSFADI